MSVSNSSLPRLRRRYNAGPRRKNGVGGSTGNVFASARIVMTAENIPSSCGPKTGRKCQSSRMRITATCLTFPSARGDGDYSCAAALRGASRRGGRSTCTRSAPGCQNTRKLPPTYGSATQPMRIHPSRSGMFRSSRLELKLMLFRLSVFAPAIFAHCTLYVTARCPAACSCCMV